ncbi:MAG: transcription termination factor Rho [Lachnospiraceae bacterium]|nr:transcription termination factor Rho [Lachnospiraceae bacterium]
MQDLNKMTVSQLREMAKTLGLSGYEKMKKTEVFALVMNTLNPDGVSGAPAKRRGRPPKNTAASTAAPVKDDSLTAAPQNDNARVEQQEKPAKKPGRRGRPPKTAATAAPAQQPEKAADTATQQTAAPQPEQQPARPIGVDDFSALDSGEKAHGILEVLPEGYGFIRCDNYLSGEDDIYVALTQIKRFGLRTGDIVTGAIRIKTGNEKFAAILNVESINGVSPEESIKRPKFENLTPIFPNERIHLEIPRGNLAMRVVDLISPIGKGQRGMIVSPPKAGKTTLIKQIANSITKNHPEMTLLILLIDERPEEVTDIKESIDGKNVEVIYSTFDELPEHHKRVAEMVINRARRLVEQGKDVTILLDSITRLSRAYNLVVPPSGRTLSGGLDPNALHSPKKFFGAARNMREGGSLTILATALVDTGSRMDDVVFEEFKGTGNMELVLDRKLSERRIFPAIDLLKSGTRRDDLLLTKEEYDIMYMIRKSVSMLKPEEATERILDLFLRTKNNAEFLDYAGKIRWQQ